MIDNEFDLKITLTILNPENYQVYVLMKIRKMLLFSKAFSVSISVLESIENHLCYANIENMYKL